MAATVAIDRRESSLPLKALDFADPLRRELTAQAERIGGALAAWGIEINSARAALDRFGPDRLRQIELRSHCDGHLLTPEATARFDGCRRRTRPSCSSTMSGCTSSCCCAMRSLPFENWTDPAISLQRHSGARGLRGLETARSVFLNEFSHEDPDARCDRPLRLRSLFEPEEARVGEPGGESYGFQTENGLVLPVGDRPRRTLPQEPKGLLSWHAARGACCSGQPTVGFSLRSCRLPRGHRAARSVRPAGKRRQAAMHELLRSLQARAPQLCGLELSAGERSYRVDLGPMLGVVSALPIGSHRQVEQEFSQTFRHIGPRRSLSSLALSQRRKVHMSCRPARQRPVDTCIAGNHYPENSVLGEAAHWSEVVAPAKAMARSSFLELNQLSRERVGRPLLLKRVRRYGNWRPQVLLSVVFRHN